MSDADTRDRILYALKSRLRMDVGLGVDYLPHTDALADLLRDAAATQPRRRQTRDAPIEPSAARAPFAPAGNAPSSADRDRIAAAPTPTNAPPSTPASGSARGGFTLVPFIEPRACSDRESVLAPLYEKAMGCGGCALCERRRSVVWGEGALNADVMFIGEGPGKDEDEQGRPFVGRSGRLLTDIIEKGMKLPRRDVYITNVVKCRPPGNRDPRPEEVAACSEYLNAQVSVIAPRLIVAVGGVAGCALLGLPPRTGGLRNKWHEYRGIPLRVIYHPSYLLRQRRGPDDRTQADRDTWADIQEVLQRLETMKG